MKYGFIKNKFTSLILIASFTFSTALVAEEQVELPVVSTPAALQEGVQVSLTPAQIEELLPWAKNSNLELNDLLESVKGLNAEDKEERLIQGIVLITQRSAHQKSELLMRYVLNRSLVVNKILLQEMGTKSVGSLDVRLRVLLTSISMALDYSKEDIATLTGNHPIRYAMFGKVYYSFLHELNKSIFDASAQYRIQKIALEWFQWDLYRDVNNIKYADLILKINNTLKMYPSHQLEDKDSLKFIRQLKKFSEYSELNDKMLVHKSITSRHMNIKEKFVKGERVYSFLFSSRDEVEMVKVTKVEVDNRYTVVNQRGYKRKGIPHSSFYVAEGCGLEFCVGDELLHNDYLINGRESKGEIISVVGVNKHMGYIVKRKDNDRIYSAFPSNLHHIKGCRNNLCVGDRVTLEGSPNLELEIVQLGANECDVKIVRENDSGFYFFSNYDFSVPYKDLIK